METSGIQDPGPYLLPFSVFHQSRKPASFGGLGWAGDAGDVGDAGDAGSWVGDRRGSFWAVLRAYEGGFPASNFSTFRGGDVKNAGR